MEAKLKPLRKVGTRTQTVALLQSGGPGTQYTNRALLSSVLQWEKLHMSKSERRKIFSSVLFHLLAIVCMMLPVYVLVKRTAEEIRLGKNGQYIPSNNIFLTLPSTTMHVTALF